MILNRNYLLFFLIIGIVILLIACDPISSSHNDANVPEEKDFDIFLKRDLESYFHELIKSKTSFQYELMREAPTQSGVAYPKYYVWVKIYNENSLLEEGAKRIAAVDKLHFDILQYLRKEEIIKHPDIIEKIFPKEICEKIKKKLY